MLKFEKSDFRQSIIIKIRDREKTFSPLFLKALTFAFGLHFIAFFVFQIGPYQFLKSEFIIPSVSVSAEMSNYEEVITFADIEFQNNRSSLLEPKYSQISLPAIPTSLSERHNVYFPSNAKHEYFNQLERECCPITFENTQLPIQFDFVQLNISGMLSEKKLITNLSALDFENFFSKNSLASIPERDRIIYTVKVNSLSGEIFWYQAKEISTNDDLNKFAEEMVKDLSFESTNTFFIESGEIEFMFTMPHTLMHQEPYDRT